MSRTRSAGVSLADLVAAVKVHGIGDSGQGGLQIHRFPGESGSDLLASIADRTEPSMAISHTSRYLLSPEITYFIDLWICL